MAPVPDASSPSEEQASASWASARGTPMAARDGAEPPIDKVGTPLRDIAVQIGPQFLELFSEDLYKSPNKACEELVSK
jgi:hypothetical protein